MKALVNLSAVPAVVEVGDPRNSSNGNTSAVGMTQGLNKNEWRMNGTEEFVVGVNNLPGI